MNGKGLIALAQWIEEVVTKYLLCFAATGHPILPSKPSYQVKYVLPLKDRVTPQPPFN